ncbi:MAG TPA: hypothetical protein VMF61_01375 [Candidatus Acidoferrales bacterium]|nr:hypothetical protein [Candidatus Acidoferrales bacterium]
MKQRHLRAAFAALVTVAVATACHGVGSLTPAGEMQSASLTGVPPATIDALRSEGLSDDQIAAATHYCTAPAAKVPGIYTTFISQGSVRGSTYTSSGYSLYVTEKYVKATPGPSATPTTGPTPSTKPPKPEYFYYGGFTLAKGKGGCAFLLTTVNHKPLKRSKYNSFGIGSPNFQTVDYKLKEPPLKNGLMTLTINGLSASGGHGPMVLKTSQGGTYTTGTVTLVGRLTLP